MAQAPLTVRIKDAYKDGVLFYKEATSISFLDFVDVYGQNGQILDLDNRILGPTYSSTTLEFALVSGFPTGYSVTGSNAHGYVTQSAFDPPPFTDDGYDHTLETSSFANAGTYNGLVKVDHKGISELLSFSNGTVNGSGTHRQITKIATAYFSLKIIVEDAPTGATSTTPTQPVFEGATTGSNTNEVELHVVPVNTSILTSSSRSITVPFTTTRVAASSSLPQIFSIRFGGVEVIPAPFTVNTNLSTSTVFSVKVLRTSSSMFRFDVTINSSFDSGAQQTLTRSKNVSIASLSNSNLTFHAINAAGSSAPIISNVGNIDIV